MCPIVSICSFSHFRRTHSQRGRFFVFVDRRINKRGSQKDMEQKKAGNYFFYDDGADDDNDDDFDDI